MASSLPFDSTCRSTQRCHVFPARCGTSKTSALLVWSQAPPQTLPHSARYCANARFAFATRHAPSASYDLPFTASYATGTPTSTTHVTERKHHIGDRSAALLECPGDRGDACQEALEDEQLTAASQPGPCRTCAEALLNGLFEGVGRSVGARR